MEEKAININQVNYSVYKTLIAVVFEDYKNTFNNLNPTRKVDFNVTLTDAVMSMHDVLLKQGKYESKAEMVKLGIEDSKMQVRYLRVGKIFEKLSYFTPILEEFKPGFIYQELNVVDKTWEECQFEVGDVMTDEKLKDSIRVEKRVREREVPIYQQSIRLKTDKEVLNVKYWKRVLYLDLLNTLMAKGIEYGEVLGVMQNLQEEKAVLSKELGKSAKEVLDNNKIVIVKEMPKPLTEGDKEYKAQMDILRDKDKKNEK